MKHSILAVLFHFVWLPAFCQADTALLKFMESMFRAEQPEETLYYTNRLGKAQIEEIKKAFNKMEYSWWAKGHIPDTIRLSKSEKKFIDAQIDKLNDIRWKGSLFENSGVISVDSVWSHQKRRFKECFDTTATGEIKRTGNFINHTNVFSFSPPIFIRDGSVFLLYFSRRCIGDCGVDGLYFYRKDNGVYEKWILVTGAAY